MVVIPGFPFYVRRSMGPDDFVMPPEDAKERMVLFRHRCAALANVLYWKIFLFRIAMALCLVYLIILAFFSRSSRGFPRSGSRTRRRPAPPG
ncbi:MAG: hypothetical protein WAV18_02460 [Roseiarcus sp.]